MSKILAKFSFDDPTLQELAFLNPHNRDQCSAARLATKFTTFTSDEMEMEFQDFRAASDADDLPEYDPQVSSAVDKFWSAVAEVRDPVETLSPIDSGATTDDDSSLEATPLDSPPNTLVSATL